MRTHAAMFLHCLSIAPPLSTGRVRRAGAVFVNADKFTQRAEQSLRL